MHMLVLQKGGSGLAFSLGPVSLCIVERGTLSILAGIDPFVREGCFTDSNKQLIPSLLIFICDCCYFSTPASSRVVPLFAL